MTLRPGKIEAQAREARKRTAPKTVIKTEAQYQRALKRIGDITNGLGANPKLWELGNLLLAAARWECPNEGEHER